MFLDLVSVLLRVFDYQLLYLPHNVVYKLLPPQTILPLSTLFIRCERLPCLRLLEPLRHWMSEMPL